MFSGLSDYLKKILPKRLFYRALLIVAIPVLVLQLVITIVFFDSLWIKTNKGMTRALIGEIKFFIEAYDNEQYNKDSLTKLFSDTQNIKANYVPHKMMPLDDFERWFSPMDRTLRRELKSKFNNYWFDTTTFRDNIDLKIKYLNGYFQFEIPKDRVANSSARIFALWITLPAFLLIAIALIFLKNQTRPIINLARASEKFGRGEDVGEYRPSGALEIRQAGYEFERMRKRIIRHLNQRSEMLSGISHDLRTPLTRIKLQLAFIKDKQLSNKLSGDVIEMEKMLNEYLQFSKNRSNEKGEKFNLSKLLDDTIKKYNNKNILIEISQNILFHGKKTLINRCISNLLDNAVKYAKNIKVNLKKSNNNIILLIDDDGPGIPKNEYENVFKPFYKIDKSRNETKSSVGLGMSIASDIIQSHGGNIKLEKSILKGLKVKITLPF